MINKSEDLITLNWKNPAFESPTVSVWCIAYNHEKHIEKALDSILMQETDFPFEIIVHDDVSTDKTADIIREYESRFPHIIKPIYEVQNQYSKHDGSFERILFENSNGEFIAICEGDDYWCDNAKLQKQVDYMTKHSECSLCCHNTIIHDVNKSDGRSDTKFNDWKDIHTLADEEIFFGWNVHTSSYLFKKEQAMLPREFCTLFGDYVRITLLRYAGDVVSLPDVMSVYNINIPTGATVQLYSTSKSAHFDIIHSRIDYLKKYNTFTNGKFKEIVDLRIADLTLQSSIDENELFEAARLLRKNKRYGLIMRSRLNNEKLLTKMKIWWRYYGSIFGKIWYWSIRFDYKF